LKPNVIVLVEDPKWSSCRGLTTCLKRAAALALRRGGSRKRNIEIAILLGSDARLGQLNARYRRKNKATNVLSFSAAEGNGAHLGDIAIAYGVTASEAREAGKSLVDHATHLAIHGVLHLLGFNHETARQAREMEPLETAILAELGIRDPYAPERKPA
jgi:probable rRNA maturation factor